MKKLIFFVFFLVLGFEFANCFECNRFDSNNLHVFSTKTSYNDTLAYYDLKSAFLDLSFVPETCELEKIYYLSRHTNRSPSLTSFNYFSELYPELLKNLREALTSNLSSDCIYLNQELSKWSFRQKKEKSHSTAKVGEEITKEIGKRFSQAFGKLLYNSDVKLGCSNKIRTLESLNAFLEGFEKPLAKQEIQEKQSMFFHTLEMDAKLQKDTEIDELIKKYEESPEIEKLRESISRRFNLETLLKLEDIRIIYEFCASNYNSFKDSFWCNFFKEEDFDLIEFLNDATVYLTFHNKNAEPLLKKSAILFQELRDFLISSEEKVFIGFAHSQVIKTTLARLKLFENKIYLTENFKESFTRSSEREWRAGRLLSYNSNFVFLKYNCADPANNQNIPKVLTLYQEQPIVIGDCEELMCPMDKFLKFIHPFHSNK